MFRDEKQTFNKVYKLKQYFTQYIYIYIYVYEQWNQVK